MGIECNYSFWDLFKAAHKREATIFEKKKFKKLNQNEKNDQVKKWAQIAGWETVTRQGTDSITYLAFAPHHFNKKLH